MRRQVARPGGRQAAASALTVGLALSVWLSPAVSGAETERVCPPGKEQVSALMVAPYIADVSTQHAVIRWIDGNPAPERLVAPGGDFVREHVQVLAGGGGWAHTAHVRLKTAGVLELFVDCGPWSGHAVRITPAPASGAPVTFVAMGDNRTNHGDHAQVLQAVVEAGPDLVVNTGDMVMTGAPEHWTRFFEVERRLVATTPLFGSFGNHEEIDRPELFDALFDCPRPGPKGTRACVRDYGDLRVILVDTEGGHHAQGEWLRAVLAEPPPAGAKRVEIIAMHRPIFTFSRHAPDLEWRSVLHPIVTDADVEVVFQGHNHTYERFEVDGVQYVTTGGGGAPRYPADYAIRPDEVKYRKKGLSVLHYVVGRLAGGTLDLEAVEPGTGAVIDRFRVD